MQFVDGAQFTPTGFRKNPAIHVIGSINIDHLYDCSLLTTEGKCVIADGYDKQIGGKGLNQAFALFQAGVKDIKFHGVIGKDGIWIRDELENLGFPTDGIKVHGELLTGNVTIQMLENHGGENAVVLYLGANEALCKDAYEEMLENVVPGDILIVQNEVKDIGSLLREAKSREMYVIFNPAPIPPKTFDPQLWKDTFPSNMLVLNKSEAVTIYQQVYGEQANLDDVEAFLRKLSARTNTNAVIMTMSEKGVAGFFRAANGGEKFITHPASVCRVVDTTGAGDTFLGFFLAELIKVSQVENVELEAMVIGCAAASITISKKGAFTAIPTMDQVLAKLNN